MSWLTIAQTCQDCGGDMSFLITDEELTSEEINELRDELGGMFCIEVRTKEIEEGINTLTGVPLQS